MKLPFAILTLLAITFNLQPLKAQFEVQHKLILESDTTIELRIKNTSDSTYLLWLANWRIFLPFEEELEFHHPISIHPINQLTLFGDSASFRSSVSYGRPISIQEGSMKTLGPNDSLFMQLKLFALPKKNCFKPDILKRTKLAYSFSFLAQENFSADSLNEAVYYSDSIFSFPIICAEEFNLYSDHSVIFTPEIQTNIGCVDNWAWRRFGYSAPVSFKSD